MNKKIIIIIAILALVALNLALFTGAFKQNKSCFRDFCIYGKGNPAEEFTNLISSSESFILYAEGDEEQTQTTREISIAVVQLFTDLTRTGKPVKLVLIGIQDGKDVSCACEEFIKGNSTQCSNEIQECKSVFPSEEQMMFKFNYPSSSKNEAVIKNNVVEVNSDSGSSLAGIVYVLRGLI